MRKRAFTLVEVILAILIISAIITVLLYFYQRSSEVRQNVIQETEFLSISRMFLDQVTAELRTARAVPEQFIGLEGSSNSISFVRATIPQMARWITSSNEAVVLPPATDLKRVTYSLLFGTNMIEGRGIDRTEELLVSAAYRAGTNSSATNAAVALNATNSFPFETNAVSLVDSNLALTNDLQLIRPPLTDKIRYLQFRYWSGTNWVDSWSSMDLPAGVEITIGREPMPAQGTTAVGAMSSAGGTDSTYEVNNSSSASGGTASDMDIGTDYPYEFFRRVVYLPNSIQFGNQSTPSPGFGVE